MGKCHRCGEVSYDLDKRALSCIQCAVRQAKQYIADEAARTKGLELALSTIESGAKLGTEMFERRVVERKGRLTWHAVNVLQDNLAACQGTAASAIEARRAETPQDGSVHESAPGRPNSGNDHA